METENTFWPRHGSSQSGFDQSLKIDRKIKARRAELPPASQPGPRIAALEKGVKLDDAVRGVDDSGEFHWRLTNATHAHGGFLSALRGWHESLDARAFQQEEAATHVLTSGLVILNGVVVGLIATAMFGILIAIVRAAEL